MLSPTDFFKMLNNKIKREWKIAFLTCLCLGILIHMPVLVSDIPNHDGLDSMYFDQNMITSGRWFLTVACGFSSYFTVPWLIGLIGLAFLGIAAAAVVELLQVRETWAVVLCSGLLVAFPALTSTFAYVFTLDGYMMALMLAVLAVLFTQKCRWGFGAGGLCLAFGMGIYQAYLPFAMILSVFAVLMTVSANAVASTETDAERAAEKAVAGETGGCRNIFIKYHGILRYLYMGIIGVVLYYVILQILLAMQGKELANYQGIDGMVSGGGNMVASVVNMYRDFIGFTFGGNVLFQNVFSGIACGVMVVLVIVVAVLRAKQEKWWKNPLLFVIIVLALFAAPVITNIILLISPNVTYHLLMRYQWVLYLMGAVAFLSNFDKKCESAKSNPATADVVAGKSGVTKISAVIQWAAFAAAFTLVFCYTVTDNIAYSNLQKKYEKTYAYCVRLLDRIEQTEGYYQGIPIAMVGVVGDEQFPATDLTGHVTSNMIGMSGEGLLYTGDNYRAFMQHYLGATLNILPAEAMGEMYYDEEYMAMDSFPGENSIRIIDGVMYIKTENTSR